MTGAIDKAPDFVYNYRYEQTEINYTLMRLQEDLRREIRACRLRGGARLNSESQLANQYLDGGRYQR